MNIWHVVNISWHKITCLSFKFRDVMVTCEKFDNRIYCDASFYPTALKGCQGIVFTHGVRMDELVGGQQEKVRPYCISETVRCRKLILGRDID